MAFRSIEEFEKILRETPPAARYLGIHWSKAMCWQDWFEIRIRMTAAEMAVRPFNAEQADVYAFLRDVATIIGEQFPRGLGAIHGSLNQEAA